MKAVILGFVGLFIVIPMTFSQEREIRLPAPHTTGGMPLMDALSQRKSVRTFSDREPDMQLLSDLLWAANGYNRRDEKKRTAPSSRNRQEIDLYVVTREGIFFYDAWEHQLVMKVAGDYRSFTGSQDYVAGVPWNIVLVANLERIGDSSERQLMASHINAGYIAQNIYLFCASAGLGTVSRAMFDEEQLRKVMQLGPNHRIILCQSVGYPL